MKQDILDLLVQELDALFADWGEPRFRSRQVFEWIHAKSAASFGQMTNLPAALRRRLGEEFELRAPTVVNTLASKMDGASKSLIELRDGNLIESVLIPAEKRLTLCVSTQVGCKFGCVFCASGANGFTRNLSSGEIVAQVILASRAAAPRQITHVVLMGVGEPLDNLENALKAVKLMNCAIGLNIGWRRITISTIGVPNTLNEIIEQTPQVGLSFSLHAPNDSIRDKIVPANKAFPIASLLDAARRHFRATRRLPTFEYVLLGKLNSQVRHAKALAALLKGVRCKVNLIPLNTTPNSDFMAPPAPDVARFLSTLEKSGVKATVRRSKGSDVGAACGQLAGRTSSD
ncbi:MAG: 23S rRNA (adenine(2503)-C(2))-methyltransferase RlmN [Candidatus Coatesbacteria bacterium]|nr:23S rRNA (adenine(2503)-C(2))-methyltransferase RlmN [Candidatus Coatesbacteria bacterium]